MCPRPPLSTPLRRFFMTPPSKNFYDPPLAPKSLHTYGVKPCNPTKLNVTIRHFIITGKSPPTCKPLRITYFETLLVLEFLRVKVA